MVIKLKNLKRPKKGWHHTEIVKEKIRKGLIGNKNGYGLIGRKLTVNHKKKISIARIGIQTWNKGISGYSLPKRPGTGLKGDKNHKWKGGISRGYKTGYYLAEYKIWRVSVFERDKYTCQRCGTKGIYLTAHHIKSFAYFPKLRFEISNGITLCEYCHSKTDNYKVRISKMPSNICV